MKPINQPQPPPQTFGLRWRGATVQPQHDRRESHVSLHAVLPNRVDDGGREVDVKVTQKHNAVVILGIGTHIYGYTPRCNTCDFPVRALLSRALTLTLMRSMPACRPAERSKFPLRLTYSYLNDTRRFRRFCFRTRVKRSRVRTWGGRTSPEPSSRPCPCCCSQ